MVEETEGGGGEKGCRRSEERCCTCSTLEPRPPSSSGHAIQNTWSVLAGSANNGLDEGEKEGERLESTQREIESSDQPQLRLPRIVHASFSAHRLTIRGKCDEGCDAIRIQVIIASGFLFDSMCPGVLFIEIERMENF